MNLKGLKPGDQITYKKSNGVLARGVILHPCTSGNGWIADMSPEFDTKSYLPWDGYGAVEYLYGKSNPFDLEDL